MFFWSILESPILIEEKCCRSAGGSLSDDWYADPPLPPEWCRGVTSPQQPRAWAEEEVMNQSCQDADTAVVC